MIRELASYGASSAANGSYSIVVGADKARGQSLTLVARYLGKSPQTKPITLNTGRQEIDFSLKEIPSGATSWW